MRTTLTTLAALAIAAPVFAGGLADPIVETPVAYAGLDLSDRNDGLTKKVLCSNVPARSGSVGGFFIPTLGFFVMEAAADMTTVDAYVMPAGFHPKEADDVTAYLQSVGLTNFELVLGDPDDRIVTIEKRPVEAPVDSLRTSVKPQEPEYELVEVVTYKNNGPEAWCR